MPPDLANFGFILKDADLLVIWNVIAIGIVGNAFKVSLFPSSLITVVL